MKQTLEQAAIEAAEDCYEMPYDENFINMKLIKDAFELGAEWAKKSLFTSVDEELPPCSDEDLLLLGIDFRGVKNIPDVGYMHSSKDGKPRKDLFVCGELVEVTHWMKVPSFEDILEANRDVLERMKEKGELKYAKNNV